MDCDLNPITLTCMFVLFAEYFNNAIRVGILNYN